MIVELKKIGVLSLAKIQAVIMAIFGLLFGLFIAVIDLILPAANGEDAFAGFGFFIVIIFPVLYTAMGFVFGALTAVLYNLTAKWAGGIEFEVAKPDKKAKK